MEPKKQWRDNMTLTDVKKQILAMIEELNPESDLLTDDPDISAKINYVINQIMIELVRLKKLPANKIIEVKENEVKSFIELADDLFQLNMIRGVKHNIVDNTVIFEEDGTANVFYYKYPTLITDENASTYEFELPIDLMQVLPYGVAGDLLKSDISANYGQVYANRYESMIQRIDPRYSTGSFYISGEDYGF